MVGQYCSSKEEEWEMASVRRLHRSEQGLPKRSFPHASDKPANGCHCKPSSDKLFRCFQSYHQIPLVLDDQEKTVFATLTGNYHYNVVPFGLKNAGATY